MVAGVVPAQSSSMLTVHVCCRCKGQQSAEKQLSIRCLPQTLALHLKRFEHTSLQVSLR